MIREVTDPSRAAISSWSLLLDRNAISAPEKITDNSSETTAYKMSSSIPYFFFLKTSRKKSIIVSISAQYASPKPPTITL
jgi:hypothetical protein